MTAAHPTVRGLLTDTGQILSRHGLWLWLEFTALSVLVTTCYALLAPGSFATHMQREEEGVFGAVFLDPVVILSEAVFALLFALAALRLWHAETGAEPGPGSWRRQMGAALVPVVVLNYVAGVAVYVGALLFILPGLIVAAATLLVIPAVVIEDRGWGAFNRSLKLTGPHLLPLTLAGAAIAVPMVLLSIILGPTAALEAQVPPLTLWLSWLTSDVVGGGLAAMSAALMMASYRALVDLDAGGRDLPEVFR